MYGVKPWQDEKEKSGEKPEEAGNEGRDALDDDNAALEKDEDRLLFRRGVCCVKCKRGAVMAPSIIEVSISYHLICFDLLPAGKQIVRHRK